MNPQLTPVFYTLLTILLLFFGLLFLTGIILQVKRFFWELNYINMEIARTTGEEQRQWQKKKRRLWLSLLPFYRG